jgi:hypothetical protein
MPDSFAAAVARVNRRARTNAVDVRLRWCRIQIRGDSTMWLITLALLILLGVLGIAGWLKARRPDTASHLQAIEQFEGWIGVIGLVWGILLLLRWISVLGGMRAGGAMLVLLLTALVVIALSLILSLPILKSIFGSGDFMARMSRLADTLVPYKIGLGFGCLVLALYSLLGHAL